MKNNKKSLMAVLFVLVAAVVLGVGYAAIAAIPLYINGTASATADEANFVVKFSGDPVGNTYIDETTTKIVSDRVAQFTTKGLTKVGDKATVTFTVLNASPDLSADITVSAAGDNDTYFKVTTIPTTKGEDGEETPVTVTAQNTTTVTIEVEVIKTPITADQSVTITATLNADPKN